MGQMSKLDRHRSGSQERPKKQKPEQKESAPKPASRVGEVLSDTILVQNGTCTALVDIGDQKNVSIAIVFPKKIPAETQTSAIRVISEKKDKATGEVQYEAILESSFNDFVELEAELRKPLSIGSLIASRVTAVASEVRSQNRNGKQSPFIVDFEGKKIFIDLTPGQELSSIDPAKEYDILIVEKKRKDGFFSGVIVAESVEGQGPVINDLAGAMNGYFSGKEAVRKDHIEKYSALESTLEQPVGKENFNLELDEYEKKAGGPTLYKTINQDRPNESLVIRPLIPVDLETADYSGQRLNQHITSDVVFVGKLDENTYEGLLRRDFEFLRFMARYEDLLSTNSAKLRAVQDAVKPASRSKQVGAAQNIMKLRSDILLDLNQIAIPSAPGQAVESEAAFNRLRDNAQQLDRLLIDYRLGVQLKRGFEGPAHHGSDVFLFELQAVEAANPLQNVGESTFDLAINNLMKQLIRLEYSPVSDPGREKNIQRVQSELAKAERELIHHNRISRHVRLSGLLDWTHVYLERYPGLFDKEVVTEFSAFQTKKVDSSGAAPNVVAEEEGKSPGPVIQPELTTAEPAAGAAVVAAPVTAIESQGGPTPPVPTTETTDPNQSVVARAVAETEPARDPELVVLENFKTVFGLPEGFNVVEVLKAGPITVVLNQRLSYTDPVSKNTLRPVAFEIHGISYDSNNPAGAKVSMIEKYEGENGGLADDGKKVVRTLAVAEKFGPFRLPPVGESEPGPGPESALVEPDPEGTGREHSDSGLDPDEDSEPVLVDEKIIAEFVAAFDLWIEPDGNKALSVLKSIQGVESVSITDKVIKAILNNGLMIMLPASVWPQGMNYQDEFDFTDPSIAVDNTTVIKKLIRPAILTGDGAQVLEKGLLEIETLNIPSAASRDTKDAAAQGGETSSVVATANESVAPTQLTEPSIAASPVEQSLPALESILPAGKTIEQYVDELRPRVAGIEEMITNALGWWEMLQLAGRKSELDSLVPELTQLLDRVTAAKKAIRDKRTTTDSDAEIIKAHTAELQFVQELSSLFSDQGIRGIAQNAASVNNFMDNKLPVLKGRAKKIAESYGRISRDMN